MGDTVSPGARQNSGHEETNIPNAPEERDNGGASRFHKIFTSTYFWYANLQEGTLRKGDYAFRIDLQDAYIHVPIHPSSRKYLRFAFENKVYQFPVLPFGLNTAHQIFTHLGHTVTGYLHRLGISVIQYIDNWLVYHPDHQVLLYHQSQLLNMLDLVGSVLNKKSELDLVQDIQFLGVQLCLDLGVQGSGGYSTCVRDTLPTNSIVSKSVPVHAFTQLGFRSYPSGTLIPKAVTASLSFLVV